MLVSPVWTAELTAIPALPDNDGVLVLREKQTVKLPNLREMTSGAPAKQATTATLYWDSEKLEVIFDCTDNSVVAGQHGRDNVQLWKDDSVYLWLLPGRYTHSAENNLLMVQVSAGGLVFDTRSEAPGFNIEGIGTEVTQTAAGWKARIQLPWKGLGVSRPKSGDVWGINLTRMDQPNEMVSSWMTVPSGNATEIWHLGHIIFASADAKPDDNDIMAAQQAVVKAHQDLRQAQDSAKGDAATPRPTVFILPEKQSVKTPALRVIQSGALAREPTTASLRWDNEGLTIAFNCADDGIVAQQQGRDNIKLWKDDCVYVWLDPVHNDNAADNMVMVQISAGGAVHDNRNKDSKVDIAGLEVEVIRTDIGWRAMVKVPWKGLGVPCPKPGDVWGLNLTRIDQPGKYDYNTMVYTSLVEIPDGDPAQVKLWGHIILAGADTKLDDKDIVTAQQTLQNARLAMLLEAKAAISEANGFNNPFPPPRYLPPAGVHPRLFVTKDFIPVLKKRLEVSKELKNLYQGIRDAGYPEGNALIYLLESDEIGLSELAQKAGRRAIDMALAQLRTMKKSQNQAQARVSGAILTKAALVYDWCYTLLYTAEKAEFVSLFNKLLPDVYNYGYGIGWPPVKGGSVIGHGTEEQLLRDMLSIGVAVFDEDRNIYNLAAGNFFSRFVPVRNYFYPCHAHWSQSDSYCPASYFLWDMHAAFLFARMGYNDIFVADQANMCFEWLYRRRPDGQLLRDGDSFNAWLFLKGEYWTFIDPLMLIAGYYGQPYAMDEYLRQLPEFEKRVKRGACSGSDPIWQILFYDPTVVPKPISSLPLTRYFKDPIGLMIARTGWTNGIDSQDAVAEMKIGGLQFESSHGHRDAGQFQVYYKGILASDAGIYNGMKGTMWSPHDVNYHRSTIAHNSILVYDPNETFSYWGGSAQAFNNGGQRIVPAGDLFDIVSGSETWSAWKNQWASYRVADVLAHQFGPDANTPDYSYLKGDLTKAYSAKMKRFLRSFVFLSLKDKQHPAVFLVYDKVVTANPEHRKYWLLHCVEKPELLPTGFVVRRAKDGYNGKMTVDCLLPSADNIEINQKEGPGHEFEVFGQQFSEEPRPNSCDALEAVGYRVEVSTKNPAETDYFLNVMQVMDNNPSPEPLAVTRIVSDTVVGARIGNAVVCFSNTAEVMSGRLTFTIPGENTDITCLLTDLAAGTWAVKRNGGPIITSAVTKEGGALYFTGRPGNYTLTPGK